MGGLPDLRGPGAEFGAWPVCEGAGLLFGENSLFDEVLLVLSCLSVWCFGLVCLLACREERLDLRSKLMLVMLAPSSGGVLLYSVLYSLCFI